MKPRSVLLLACYELGHQPLSLAWPLAALEEAGIPATPRDLSVEPFPQEEAAEAGFVGIAAPMHTALRLGVGAAKRVRALNPRAHICFYGLYAWLNADYLLAGLADSVIAGEYDQPLAALVRALAEGGDPAAVPGVSTPTQRARPHLARIRFPTPERRKLPDLSHYAHFAQNGSRRLAGYVEASRGCLHTCRHCPVVPVYGGRFFVVPLETVLADIRQQVAAGAGHITFGDPDFLNGPGHALKVTRALHEEFPHVTFDFTAKVEHILERRELFPELRELGCSFVVSAFEAASDRVLERLQKGHTVADMGTALEILTEAGVAVQPTWMPFTPWTGLQDYLYLLGWIRAHNLIPHVPPVQLTVRMLVPPGSALLDHPDVSTWLGELEAENFTYHWAHPDPRMDALQAGAATIAAEQADADPFDAFAAIERLAYETAGYEAPQPARRDLRLPPPPRLTEDWFC